MRQPVRHLLVYADGRVEDAKTELCGLYFIKSELVDGDHWIRKFEIRLARTVDPKNPERLKVCTMVGVEVSFTLNSTRAEMAARAAKRRSESMKQCLWGIANYPGDGD